MLEKQLSCDQKRANTLHILTSNDPIVREVISHLAYASWEAHKGLCLSKESDWELSVRRLDQAVNGAYSPFFHPLDLLAGDLNNELDQRTMRAYNKRSLRDEAPPSTDQQTNADRLSALVEFAREIIDSEKQLFYCSSAA